jgi:hypothetical protein
MVNFGLIRANKTSVVSLVASNESGVPALCKLNSAGN